MSNEIDWEKGCYLGKEFIEDEEKEEIIIEFIFYTPAQLKSFDFWLNDKKITAVYGNGLLKVSFFELISKKLIVDLKNNKSVEFIIGYISKYLPKINKEILKQKYLSGNFFVRTYSTTLDIFKINLQNRKQTDTRFVLSWPCNVSNFPPLQVLAESEDEVYIRDYIDAISLYFVGNYDDCIRKLITSVENSFRFYKLKKANPSGLKKIFSFLYLKKQKFKNIIIQNIYRDSFENQVIVENILFIYEIRNKIVHDKFRLKTDDKWFCKKAIGTLNYMYQFLGHRNKIVEYMIYLQQQFFGMERLVEGIDLNYMKNVGVNISNTKSSINFDLNKFIFDGLKITKEEQSLILKK